MRTEITIEEVMNLSRKGHSQRRIAQILKTSRTTVAKRIKDAGQVLSKPIGEKVDSFPLPEGEFERCPECGCIVQMPCLACQLVKQGVTPPASEPTPDDDFFNLKLTPDQQLRYEEVRAVRGLSSLLPAINTYARFAETVDVLRNKNLLIAHK